MDSIETSTISGRNELLRLAESREENTVPELPVSPLEEEAANMYKEKEQIERDILKLAYEYEKKLKAEHPTLKTLDEKWGETLRKAKVDKEKLLADFYERAQRQEFGKGELAVIETSLSESRLARIVAFKNKSDNNEPWRIENNVVNECDLLAPGQLSESAHFVALPLEGTSEEEYDDFFNKFRYTWQFDYLLRLFPKEYKPKVTAGEIFNYGSMSHHSGEIHAFAMVLPTGRLAVFSKYSGENDGIYEKQKFWGAVSDPRFEPQWSAKYGGLMNNEAMETILTEEEIAFLKKKKMLSRIPEDRLIEESVSGTEENGDSQH